MVAPEDPGEIEFLDTFVARSRSDSEAIAVGGSSWRWLGVGCLLAVGLWLVTSSDDQAEPDAPGLGEVAQPELEPLADDLNTPRVGASPSPTWPSPPLDRDPYVVRVPGPVELPPDIPVERLASTTIVYVNTAGDPTVVSFDTGDVWKVDVAKMRVHETFAVEAGRVVSFEGSNASLDAATDQAIVFHTYRDVDPPGVGTMADLRGVGRGPEVCLSERTCARPGSGTERVLRDGLVAERFDEGRHWEIARLLESWEPVDRWLISDGGYRIPAPVGLIWVIGPPERGGSSSSSGVI